MGEAHTDFPESLAMAGLCRMGLHKALGREADMMRADMRGHTVLISKNSGQSGETLLNPSGIHLTLQEVHAS